MLVEHELEWALHMACRRLIERLAALNCAAPSAQLPKPARHVTDSNRTTDEQMYAGVLVCVSVCVRTRVWFRFFVFILDYIFYFS